MADKIIKSAPKMLVLPEHELPEAPDPPPFDLPLKARYIKDADWDAFAINAFTFIIFALGLGVLTVERISDDPRFVFAIALGVPTILTIILCFNGRLGTTPNNLEAFVYLDVWTKDVIVYAKGFHFVAWTAKKQKDVITYRKEEILTFCNEDGNALSALCFDGRSVLYEFTVNYSVVESEGENIGNSLKYSREQIRRSIRASLQARVESITALNSFEVLYRNRDRVELWNSTCFGGVSTQTGLELRYNITIDDPLLNSISLDPQSKKTFEKKSTGDQTFELAEKFTKLNVPSQEALEAALSIMQDDAEKAFINVSLEGAPNLTSFALGQGVGAFGGASTGGKGKGKGKGKNKGKGPNQKKDNTNDDDDDNNQNN